MKYVDIIVLFNLVFADRIDSIKDKEGEFKKLIQ
jgi:hypothetical protein